MSCLAWPQRLLSWLTRSIKRDLACSSTELYTCPSKAAWLGPYFNSSPHGRHLERVSVVLQPKAPKNIFAPADSCMFSSKFFNAQWWHKTEFVHLHHKVVTFSIILPRTESWVKVLYSGLQNYLITVLRVKFLEQLNAYAANTSARLTKVTDILLTCKYLHNIQIYHACVQFQKSSPETIHILWKLLLNVLM